MRTDGAILLSLATTFASLSCVAVGGANAIAPEVQRQALAAGWMDQATFSTLFAISQAAPGPNVLLVSLIGWQVAGFAGLVVATLAMLGPSSLMAFAIGRFMQHAAEKTWFQIAQSAFTPIAIGLIVASGVTMAESAAHNWALALVSVGAMLFVLRTSFSPLWAILIGAGVGAAQMYFNA